MAFKEYPCVGYTPGYPVGSHCLGCEHTLWGSFLIVSAAHSLGVWVWQPSQGPAPSAHSSRGSGGSPGTSHQDSLRVHHSQAGLSPGCASCPLRAGWAWCPVSSLGVLPASSFGCFPHHCSAFLPLLRLCALPSGSPLLGLSDSPTASASCFHLLGCRNLDFLWCFSVSLRGMGVRPRSFFLQGPLQTSSTTPSTETSLPWRCCLLPLVVAMSSDRSIFNNKSFALIRFAKEIWSLYFPTELPDY